jgi:hypothetical protein
VSRIDVISEEVDCVEEIVCVCVIISLLNSRSPLPCYTPYIQPHFLSLDYLCKQGVARHLC